MVRLGCGGRRRPSICSSTPRHFTRQSADEFGSSRSLASVFHFLLVEILPCSRPSLVATRTGPICGPWQQPRHSTLRRSLAYLRYIWAATTNGLRSSARFLTKTARAEAPRSRLAWGDASSTNWSHSPTPRSHRAAPGHSVTERRPRPTSPLLKPNVDRRGRTGETSLVEGTRHMATSCTPNATDCWVVDAVRFGACARIVGQWLDSEVGERKVGRTQRPVHPTVHI